MHSRVQHYSQDICLDTANMLSDSPLGRAGLDSASGDDCSFEVKGFPDDKWRTLQLPTFHVENHYNVQLQTCREKDPLTVCQLCYFEFVTNLKKIFAHIMRRIRIETPKGPVQKNKMMLLLCAPPKLSPAHVKVRAFYFFFRGPLNMKRCCGDIMTPHGPFVLVYFPCVFFRCIQ